MLIGSKDISEILMRTLMFTVKITFALATLMIGISSVYVFRYYDDAAIPSAETILVEDPVLRVNACELSESGGRFIDTRISVDATIWHVSWSNKQQSADFVMVEQIEPCHGPYDPFINTELDLQNYIGPNQNLKDVLGPFKREVDVRIVGTLKRSEKQDHLVFYRIVPEEIQLISPWRKFTTKAAS